MNGSASALPFVHPGAGDARRDLEFALHAP